MAAFPTWAPKLALHGIGLGISPKGTASGSSRMVCPTFVEQYMHDHPRPNLHFIWVGPLGWWDLGRIPPPRRREASAFTTCFGGTRLPQRRSGSWPWSRSTLFITSVGIQSARRQLWRIGKPFVWGPIGGGQALPWRFLTAVGSAAVPELLRNLRVGIMPGHRARAVPARGPICCWRQTARAAVCCTGLARDT
jgi:hypothetical protein